MRNQARLGPILILILGSCTGSGGGPDGSSGAPPGGPANVAPDASANMAPDGSAPDGSAPDGSAPDGSADAAPLVARYYVSPTGNDANPGTVALPFRTIQKAADSVVAGDVVFVRGGTYPEMVTLHTSGTAASPIKIWAYPGEHPVIDGGTTLPDSNFSSMVRIDGEYVTFFGFEVKNINMSGAHNEGTGIIIVGHHNTVSHAVVHNSWGSGIAALGDYSVVEDSEVYDCCMENSINPGAQTNGSGLSAMRDVVDNFTDYAILRRNTVHDVWGEGMSTYEAHHTILEDNTVYNNWSTNIYVSDADYVTVQRNFVYQNKNLTGASQVGILMGDEKATPPSAYNVVINNVVYGCRKNFYWWGSNFANGMDHFLIANNTFVNSADTADVQFGASPMTSVVFENNIVSQGGGLLPILLSNGNKVGITFNNNLWSSAPGALASGPGDVVADPKLAALGSPYVATSFALLSTSPAVNAGVTVAGVNDDYGRVARPRGTAYDVGAFESW